MRAIKKLQPWMTIFPFSAVILLILAITLLLRFLPQKLPLFYSLIWGENQLANHTQFFILPAILSSIALLNLGLYHYLHPAQSFFKKVLMGATILSTLILIITFVKIVLLFI